MKLIKVEAKGFKSFADKIILNFDGGVVGIVGPNGSGKSNINDAIKWVLGETSAKSLRGNSMEDVIFAGSKTVKAMNFAEVSLTFDNSARTISLPHRQIVITRKIVRGKGGNQYFINGESARLRDIKEISMESGMSKSSLAIIGQGTVSDIAEADVYQRRAIFEEAAGISKYKVRKKEALRKLDKVTEGLEKIETITNELERQLVPLRKQADKAKIYLSKKDVLKNVELSLIAHDVKFFQGQFDKLSGELESVLSTKDDIETRINALDLDIDEKNKFKYKLENQVLQLNNKYQDVSEKLNNLEIRDSKAAQRRQMIMDGEIQATSQERLNIIKEELGELSSKLNQYNIWMSKSSLEISEKKNAISKLHSNIAKIEFDLTSKQRQLIKLKTERHFLVNQRDNKSNLHKGTKTILDNKQIFPGVKGIVSDLLKVNDKFEKAISTILQSSLQNVVVDDNQTAIKAINFLRKNRGGRATFVPLSTIKPKSVHTEFETIVSIQNGYIGIASSLVQTEPQFAVLNKFLLGNVIVADNIENANHISRLIHNRNMIVTLEGDVIRVGGIMSGGAGSHNKTSMNVDSQINRIEKEIPIVEDEIRNLNKIISTINMQIDEESSMVAELNIESVKLIEKNNIVESQFNNLKSQFESETKEKFKQAKETEAFENIEYWESEKSAIKASLSSKRNSIMNLNNDLSKMVVAKTEFEKTLRELIENSSSKMTEKNQAEFMINSSKQRLMEEYELTIESIQDYQLDIDRDEAYEIVQKIRNEIKELGHVNVDSIQAFEDVNARFIKFSKSKSELANAQQTILSAIKEMDQIIVTRLDKTVKDVNKEINSIFQTMFGGGHAEVKYTDPSNLLETGIDVIAQPPGKTIKNLKLFSGGEKALIAISLLFAILKSKPLPLVILDEVEAALDDANVVRYANFLQELKIYTQFIVVTHRVGTMARVDHLFGATMQQRGVTSFFSVELAKAKEMIEG